MSDQENKTVLELSDNFLEKAISIPVSAINLPARTERAVKNSGAINSAEAVNFIFNNLSNASGIGEKTLQDSLKAIQSFVSKVERCPTEDIRKLADPRELFFESSQGNVVDAFPGVAELYFDKKFSKEKKRNLDIVSKRFSLNGGRRYTLEELGTYYDVTRERIRQIEARSIKDIGLLLSGALKTKNWRIDDSIVNNYNKLKEQLSSSPTLILYQEVNALFDRLFDSRLSSGYLEFFMEVAGFIKLPQTFEGFRGTIKPCWCLASQYQNKEIEAIFKSLDVLFDNPSSVFSLFDLTILSKKKAKKKISNESLTIALTACKEVEVVEEVVRVKFIYLRSAADKAFRILESSGTPIHYSAITREINLLAKDSPSFRAISGHPSLVTEST